jgi:TonB family protein
MSESWKQWTGQVVNGQFALQRYLGGSDHSAVFLTERVAGLGKAAIKLLPADLKTADAQLFRWKLATKLPHPHLLRIFEMGQCKLGETDLLYVVMEYAEEDLAQILPQRPLTPEEARQMLPPLLNALAYVHDKGFVHGRVQPANIMAVADQVKISSDSLYPSAEPCGTQGKPRAYDAPEVATGQTSAASDVWSLGAALVEVLTQRLPVSQGTDQPPALPQGVPQPFLDITRHCLHPDPQRRWSVADITTRLRSGSGSPEKQGVSSSAPGAGKKYSARYLVPIAVGLVLVLLAGSRIRTSHPQAQPEAVQLASPAAREPARAEASQKPTPLARAASSSAKVDEGAAATAPASPSSKEPAGAVPQVMGGNASGASTKTSPPGVVPGVIVRQVVPDVPQRARDTIQGHIRIRVRIAVDTSGNVAKATLESAGPSKYFARLALQAAQGWKFTPPQADGQPVSSEWILRFSFGRTAVDVHPTQVSR